MSWPQYLLHRTELVGSNILYGVDQVGEYFGDLFGITTPKYAYEISKYKEEQERIARELKEQQENSWNKEEATTEQSGVITTAPSQPKREEV